MKLFTIVLFVLVVAGSEAQVIVPPRSSSLFTALVTANVSTNSTTGVTTFAYQVENTGPPSVEAIDVVRIRWHGQGALNGFSIQSPPGWMVLSDGSRGDIISWAAIQYPDESVAELSEPLSAIRSGQRLGGFSFQTKASAVVGQALLQGFTPMVAVQEGTEVDPKYTPPFDLDSVVVTTWVANTDSIALPEATPSKNNLLILSNRDEIRTNAATRVSIKVKFGLVGETANLGSFSATLNGKAVTTQVTVVSAVEQIATFDISQGVLVRGMNMFRASVEGTVPGITGTQTDWEAVTFSVPTVAGDANGDGVTDCADVAIVQSSFGKRIGQPGFDARADLNGDQVGDVRDLATVTRNLPAGLTCPQQ